MPAMSVGGLASGLDTNSIIAQLTALEQAKVTREVQKKDSAQKTLDKFNELQTRIGNLQLKAKSLELPKDFNMFKANSNYEEYATISGGEGATAGNYELVVHQLATTQKVASDAFAAINKPISDYVSGAFSSDGTATISLSTSAAAQKADPNKKEVEVKINSGDTLKDIVNKINAAEGAGVKASLMTLSNGENRIVLTAVDTGTNGFFLKEDGGSSLLGALGIVSYKDENDNEVQKATSGNALTLINGGAATESTTFDKLNTVLNKNNLEVGDKIGIYLENGGWITFDLYGHEAGVDSNGKAKAREIGDVLNEINTNVLSGAGFEISLNSSGELVFQGNMTGDANFDSSVLNKVKIQMGTFTETSPDVWDIAPNAVKKDMGSLTNRNIFKNIINEGVNAFYTIDGMSISSQSNNDDKTIVGTTFNLKKADPEKVIKLSLEPDMSGLADKIGAFVEEFNALLKFIDENSTAKVVEETDKSTGKKTSKREVGPFTGDSAISGLRDNLRSMFSSVIRELSNSPTKEGAPNPDYNGYFTVYSSASRLGIITNKDGYYDVDKEKLTKALNADFEGVRKLFTTGGFSDTTGFGIGRFSKDSQAGLYEYKQDFDDYGQWYLNGSNEPLQGTWTGNTIFTTKNGLSIEVPEGFALTAGQTVKVTFVRGIAGQLANFVEKANSGSYSESSGRFSGGFFKDTKETYQKRIDEIQKRIDQLQLRVDNYESRLVKQFSALERSMSNLQAQSSNMMSALSGISYNK